MHRVYSLHLILWSNEWIRSILWYIYAVSIATITDIYLRPAVLKYHDFANFFKSLFVIWQKKKMYREIHSEKHASFKRKPKYYVLKAISPFPLLNLFDENFRQHSSSCVNPHIWTEICMDKTAGMLADKSIRKFGLNIFWGILEKCSKYFHTFSKYLLKICLIFRILKH